MLLQTHRFSKRLQQRQFTLRSALRVEVMSVLHLHTLSQHLRFSRVCRAQTRHTRLVELRLRE